MIKKFLIILIESEAREYFETNVYKFNVPRNVTLSKS